MAKLFFVLSGEHETLPVSELKAILEAEDQTFKILEKLDQLVRIEAELNCIEAIKNRAALTRICGLEQFTCEAQTSAIVEATHSINLNEVLEHGDSFAVRIRHVKDYSPKINGMTLERKIGEIILDKTMKSEVNLRNPDKTFIGVLTRERFVFGLKLAEIPAMPFVERRPRKRPFFHPSAMHPKLARSMVNLARPKRGELVFDPFCGTGSMLIEAAQIGCQVLGLDIQRRMVRGSLRNFVHFKIKPEGLIVADARSPPITNVDCVVTDPPYGRSATTLKRTIKQIVEEVFGSVYDMLDIGKRVCIAAPKTLNAKYLGEAYGYKHIESHLVYVHRSLTREIAVFEKV